MTRITTKQIPCTKVFLPYGQVKQPIPSAAIIKKTQNNYACGLCGGLYSDDTKKKNGTELITVCNFVENGLTQHAKKLWMNFIS